MAKDEIKKLLDNYKKVLEQEHDKFQNTIKNNLNNFKKKTLDQI
jgi:hypothetical protein